MFCKRFPSVALAFNLLEIRLVNKPLPGQYYDSSASLNLKSSSCLPLSFTSGIFAGVKCLHEFEPQIIHRDLKPENILMGAERRPSEGCGLRAVQGDRSRGRFLPAPPGHLQQAGQGHYRISAARGVRLRRGCGCWGHRLHHSRRRVVRLTCDTSRLYLEGAYIA